MAHWDHRWLLGGGLGSGKSEVRRLLDEAGIATIDSDAVGHEVLVRGSPAHDEVTAEWPEAVVNGEIDRSALGRVVFADLDQLRRLEALTHPHIFGIISRRVEEIVGPVVVEIPLAKQPFDGVWRWMVVDADDEIRLQRAVERGMGEERARSVMDAQPSRAEWLAKADLVIPNHGDRDALRHAVSQVLPLL